jgi:hypothetical protein
MTDLRVAVLGDSAVWGQGLPPDARFAVIAAREIAARADRDPVIDPSNPRSGAKILAAVKSGSDQVLLPSGASLSVRRGDRAHFYDLYPALFDTDEQARAFFAGTDEEVALRLFGEIPATFPTITYQVERVPDEVGREIELVIVDGSTNDVGVEEVLDPEGDALAELAEDIRRFSYEALKNLLTDLRAKFPRAVVVVTGYFSPLSTESDHDELVSLAKFVSGRPGWQLALNDVLVSPWGRLLLFPLSLLGQDVDEKVDQVVRRAGFAHRRGLYWMRRAVAELNETAAARPGLIFAHPGFRSENALFAAGTPFVFEGYKLPGAGDHEVGDPMLAQRRSAIPRGQHLSALRTTRTGLEKLASGGPNVAVEEILERLADLRPRLDGPTSLLGRLDALLTAPEGLRARRAGEALPGVEAEIGRIEVSTIASFVHPNPAGARRYADVIVDRHSRHVRTSVRRELSSLSRDGVMSVRDAARRYGFGPGVRLRSFVQHTTVDTLAVELTADVLLPLFPDLIPLRLATGEGRRFPLDAPIGGLCVADTFGTLPLGEITELGLELTTDLPVRVRVEDFRLLVNGVPVFSSAGPHVLIGGTPLTFPYPAAAAESGLVVEPDTVLFGSVGIGTVRRRTVRIANRTGTRIDVSVPAGSGPFRWPAVDVTLDHGGEREVDVEFGPTSTAFVQATLTAVHAGRVHPVRLSGKGAGGIPEEDPDAPPPPRLKITPSLVNFGPLPLGAEETRTVTIENVTGALVSLSIAAPPAGSRFDWEPFSGTLANGGRRGVTVRFGPVPAGVSTGTLTVTSSAPGSPHRIALTGKSPGGFPTEEP